MRVLCLLGLLSLLAGCENSEPGSSRLSTCEDFGTCPPGRLVEPVTDRRDLPPFVIAENPPAPISGGTLVLSADGRVAVAAESDRDRVQIVDLDPTADAAVLATLELQPGDEPGRVIQVGSRYHVVLRGAGAIQKVLTEGEWSLGDRTPVCASPRGIAYDEERGVLLVACVGGDLVGIDEATGAERSRQHLASDLRDVVVTESNIFVSRFRSADVLVLSKAGALQSTVKLSEHELESVFRDGQVANVAYRMVQSGPDQVVVSHQLSVSTEEIPPNEGGGYGGGTACLAAVVEAGLTVVDASGVLSMNAHGNLVLPVDVAIAPRASSRAEFGEVAIAAAGARSDGGGSAGGSVAFIHREDLLGELTVPAACRGVRFSMSGQTIGVAFNPDGILVRQTRSPGSLWVGGREIALPGPSTTDTGHDLFFGDAGGGIACASCHAEGGEDGLTWHFAEVGPRRTQELRGGIMGSAPFHWNGEMEDFAQLAEDVMAERMGGPALPSAYLRALGSYIDSMALPAREPAADPEAVARGAEIFASEEADCATCHSDVRLSGPGSFDVGKGSTMQVPGLLGLSLRAPYMHDGCAETIASRFYPACGGTEHGSVEHLDEQGLTDLMAYLEAL